MNLTVGLGGVSDRSLRSSKSLHPRQTERYSLSSLRVHRRYLFSSSYKQLLQKSLRGTFMRVTVWPIMHSPVMTLVRILSVICLSENSMSPQRPVKEIELSFSPVQTYTSTWFFSTPKSSMFHEEKKHDRGCGIFLCTVAFTWHRG